MLRPAEEPPCPQPAGAGKVAVVVFAQEIGTVREMAVAVVAVVVFAQEFGPVRKTLAVMTLAVVLAFAQEIGPGRSTPAKTLETRPRRLPAKIIKDFMMDKRDVSKAGGRYRVAIKEEGRRCPEG